jgi:lipopolysaccharide/colanic/teichoic acid biosynthesis glycosyltransferase
MKRASFPVREMSAWSLLEGLLVLSGHETETMPDSRGRERASRDGFFVIKRCIDLVGSIALLVLLSPAMFIIALCIRATSSGPALLRQRRLTEGGKEFTLLKFRSMRQDAESVSGPRLAEAGDPRVTKIGRILRKTRLDELPQLINVLKGDMSLIGPRPERPEIAAQLGERIHGFNRRLAAKAGLTGLAQVIQGYPDDVSGYRTKLAWDVVYIKQQSLALDLWIALRTIGTVLSGSGAK